MAKFANSPTDSNLPAKLLVVQQIWRRQFLSGTAVWLFFLLNAAIYIAQWRLGNLRSNPWVWLAGMLPLTVAVGYVCWWTCDLLGRGSHRIQAAGRGMFYVLPIICFGCYVIHTKQTVDARGNLALTNLLRVVVCWYCGAGEVEGLWRYPARTYGKYVELWSATPEPNATTWITALDQHALSLAAELGKPLADGRIPWVRGSLLGMTGRNVGSFAIADDLNGPPEYIDFHEVAHAVITRICGFDHEPAMLLAEGFAEVHSSPKIDEQLSRLVRKLRNMRERGDTTRISDWLMEENYGRSWGPAYTHGGPFVGYLLQRYGGPRFLELYATIRRKTALADVERVLAIVWDELEADFWQWLNDQTDGGEPKDSAHITFAPEVDSKLWDELLAGAQKHALKQEDWPERMAFELVGTQQGKLNSSIRFLVDADQWWYCTKSYGETSYSDWRLSSAQRTAGLLQQGTGPLLPWNGEDASIRSSIQLSIHNFLNRGQLSREFDWIVGNPDPVAFVEFLRIERPTAERPTWLAEFRSVEESMILGLDVKADWQIELAADDFRIQRNEMQLDQSERRVEYTHEPWIDRRLTRHIETVEKDSRYISTLRDLSEAEARELRDEVESVIARGPTPQASPWFRWPNPLEFAGVWSIAAVIMLTIRRP